MMFKYAWILLFLVSLLSFKGRDKKNSASDSLQKDTRKLEKAIIRSLSKSNCKVSESIFFYHIYECELFEKDSFSLSDVKYKYHKNKRTLRGTTIVCERHLPIASYYNNTLFCYSNYNDDFSKEERRLVDLIISHRPNLVLTINYNQFFFIFGTEVKVLHEKNNEYAFYEFDFYMKNLWRVNF